MGDWWVAISVAIIGGPLVAVLTRLEKRNTEQHGNSMKVLEATQKLVEQIDGKVDKVDDKVERLDTRLFNHLEWHNDEPKQPT